MGQPTVRSGGDSEKTSTVCETLGHLVKFSGASGFEHAVARYIYDTLKSRADDCWVDGLGNVIVHQQGGHPGPKLVVSVHMDEVGFIVKKIESNGFLRFEKLGGHDDRILPAQRVTVMSQNGPRRGVIGTLSAHMRRFDQETRVRNYTELYIDVGVDSREAAEALGIAVGDPVTWPTEMETMGNGRLVGKSFDDRAGCAVLLDTLLHTDFADVHGEVYGVFSVQEEVGLRGAKVAGEQISADVALAVDTTAVSDTLESMMDHSLSLGLGPCVKVMDNSLIASVSVRRKLVEAARAHGIPHQLEVFTGIGTDAGELHKAQAGIPSGVISIPSRYAHSPVEVIDIADLEHTAALLQAFILSMRDAAEFRFLAE